MLNSLQYLFCIRFRNPLELLFHLPLIKQYLIVLFGRVQSLILFALQILFAMLRATSSFGLRPHTLSQNNTQLFCSAEYKIRKFGMTRTPTVMLNSFQHLLLNHINLYKSSKLGFIFFINFIFQSRCQFFNCFSLLIAVSIFSVNS